MNVAVPICPVCNNRPLGVVCMVCETLWIAPQVEPPRPQMSRWLRGIQDTTAGEIRVGGPERRHWD